jgi:hypothetical protein
MAKRPCGDLKIIFVEREGGCDEKRLQAALRMLISEKDFIDHFAPRTVGDRRKIGAGQPDNHTSGGEPSYPHGVL